MILLTGASGFIGQALVSALGNSEFRCLVRTKPRQQRMAYVHGCIDHTSDYSAALQGVETVIHVAAVAHRTKQKRSISYADFREVNVEGTLNLASQAARFGVKRFIFVSSIGVNGGVSQGKPFQYDDAPSPWDDYTRSKYEAEQGLWNIQAKTGLEIVIIRPPLVYGPSAPGNFGKLVAAIEREQWLPLGMIYNQRSFVALDNLVDLIITCVSHPNAVNQTFLVSDDQDVSTTEFLKKIALAFGKKSRLIPVPMGWIQLIAGLLGKRLVAQRLCGSLLVDISHTKKTLSWKPPVTMEQQLAKIAASLSQHTPDN